MKIEDFICPFVDRKCNKDCLACLRYKDNTFKCARLNGVTMNIDDNLKEKG